MRSRPMNRTRARASTLSSAADRDYRPAVDVSARQRPPSPPLATCSFDEGGQGGGEGSFASLSFLAIQKEEDESEYRFDQLRYVFLLSLSLANRLKRNHRDSVLGNHRRLGFHLIARLDF